MKPRSECTAEEISRWRQGQFSVLLPCLKCGKDFESRSAGERFCKPCRETNKAVATSHLGKSQYQHFKEKENTESKREKANIGW